MATDDELSYYASAGTMTDLSGLALPELPSEPTEVAALVQGIVMHPAWAIAYDVTHTPQRLEELQIRSAARMVEAMYAADPRPITEPRDPGDRLVGNCRDFATLTTALLRHGGTPARARCGFGGYFEAGRWVDHWVVEHWDDQRWVMLDPQIDALQQEVTGLPDPADLTTDQFLTAGKAWARCQAGELDGDTFGIFDMWGQWFIESNVGRDMASLNKVEMLPWDGWGAWGENANDAVTSEAWTDELAALTVSDDHAAIRQRYATDPDVSVPASITSFIDGEVVPVLVAELA